MLYHFNGGPGCGLISPMIQENVDHVAPPMHIPAPTCALVYTKKDGYYLKPMDNFQLPPKIYGSLSHYAKHFFMTYKLQDIGQTGIILAGTSGSGKTLLSHILSTKARIERHIPTIVIGENSVDSVTNFMYAIKSLPECVLLFDEFDKTFRTRNQQEELLPLFDGAFTSKKLTILTLNHLYIVSQHLINRPTRIRYLLEFKGLETDFIREYCDDNLKDINETNEILRITRTFDIFSFDMLQMLVREMNEYDKKAVDAIKLMNIKNLGAREIMYIPTAEAIDPTVSTIKKEVNNNSFMSMINRQKIIGTSPITLQIQIVNRPSQNDTPPAMPMPNETMKPITIKNPKEDLTEKVDENDDLMYVYEDPDNNVRITFKRMIGEEESSEHGRSTIYD